MAHLRNFASVGKKIVGIGRNYVAHAKELNNPIPTKPFFFLKPTTSYLLQPNPIVLPYPGIVIHHEVELGIVIGKTGKSKRFSLLFIVNSFLLTTITDIPESEALDYVGGYTIALDLTARQEQDEAKSNVSAIHMIVYSVTNPNSLRDFRGRSRKAMTASALLVSSSQRSRSLILRTLR